MEHIDMILKLSEKANVSYDDARDVLERSDWDMLSALTLLEAEGKIKPLTSSMTTVENEYQYEEVKATASSRREKNGGLWEKIVRLFRLLMNNYFIIRRGGKEILSLPALFAIIIALWMIWPVIIGLIIGFMFNCTYSVEERK